MAETDPVVVRIIASQRDLEKSLAASVRATERAATACEKAFKGANDNMTKNWSRSMKSMESQTASFGSKMKGALGSFTGMGGGANFGTFLAGAAPALAGAFSVDAIMKFIDANTRLQNSLKTTGLAGEDLEGVYQQLKSAALANGVPVNALGELYSKLALTQKELGVSSQDLLKFTAAIAGDLRAGGVSADQAAGALLQLSQALGSGIVRAEEFNSVLEGAPTIAQAAANGLEAAGGSVAKLRQLVIGGTLTSREFFDAIQKGSASISGRAADNVLTIGQAFTNLNTTLQDTVKEFDEVTGASGGLAQFLGKDIPELITEIGKAVEFALKSIVTVMGAVNQAQGGLTKFLNDLGRAMNLPDLGSWAEQEFGNKNVRSLNNPHSDEDLRVLNAMNAATKLYQGSVHGASEQVNDLIQSMVDLGRTDTATTLSESWKNLDLNVAQGTASVEDFDKAIAAARATGTDAGEQIAARLETMKKIWPDIHAAMKDPDKRLQEIKQHTADIVTETQKLAPEWEKARQAIAAGAAAINGVQLNMGDTVKFTGGTDAAVGAMENLVGADENINTAQINAFMKAGGIDINAAQTAWCAAFVNSALKQMGIKGSGSMTATDFAKWGVQVNPEDIKRGDVLVEMRGKQAGQQGGHVGLATGQRRIGPGGQMQVEMISGNSGDKVRKTWEDAATLTPRRAGEGTVIDPKQLKAAQETDPQAKAADKAAEKARADAAQAADQRKKKAAEGQKAYADEIAAQQKAIDQQVKHNEVMADGTRSIDQRTLAVEADTIAQQLNDEAKKNGIVLTDDIIAQHQKLGMAMAQAKLAQDNITKSQQDWTKQQEANKKAMEEFGQEIGQVAQSAIGGFINDLRNGVSAGEAFTNMLDRIVDGLINMALQSLFSKNALGGVLGSLFGGTTGVTAHGGGTIGLSGRRDGRRFSPLLWAGAPRYHSGGIVGLRPGEMPIIAQRGEIVIPKGMARTTSGGMVDQSTVNQQNRISVDMGSGFVAGSPSDAKKVGQNIQLLIQAELIKQSRPGGLLRKVPA